MKIQDIAKEAGVSVSTVSRALNDSKEIGAKTKSKILAIIEKHNYKPSAVARSLIKQDSRALGVLVPNIGDPFFAEIVNNITRIADENNLSVIIANSFENFQKEQKELDLFIENRVKGIILCPSNAADSDSISNILRIQKSQIPLVLIDRNITNINVSGVFSDDFFGGYEATKALISAGHTHIAIITGPENSKPAQARFEGYRFCLNEFGIKYNPEYVIRTDFSAISSYNHSKESISKNTDITAYFTCNYPTTVGFLGACSDLNLKIPDDIALFSFDCPDIYKVLKFNISYIDRSIADMGTEAALLLLEKINNPDSFQTKRIILKTSVVKRGSEIKTH